MERSDVEKGAPAGQPMVIRDLDRTSSSMTTGSPDTPLTRQEVKDMLTQERKIMEEEMEARMKALIQQERDETRPFLTPTMKEVYESTPARSERSDDEQPLSDLRNLTVSAPVPDVENHASPENITGHEKKGGEWHAPFGESVYTLIYMCPRTTQSFWYGIFICALQMLTIVLILISIIDRGSETNTIGLPAMVDLVVTVTQGVAVFMALAFMTDLIEAVLKLQDGFYPEIVERHPGATFSTWLFSCLAQFIAGTLLLVTIFILTMQVEQVLSIMLNFAALHFISEIDDIGYKIANLGFITNHIQEQVQQVADVKVPKRMGRNRSRRALFFLTMLGLFIGYIILKNRQIDGDYLPTFAYVQFGDAYNWRIPYYSGILQSENTRTVVRRKYRDTGTKNILLSYCLEEKAWTFSETDNPCDYFAKSYETETYVVTSIPDTEWQVKDSNSRLHPFDSFTLVSQDCDPSTCRGNCGLDGFCQCNSGQFGLDCEFSDVCEDLVTDERFPQFPTVEIFPASDKWYDMENSAVSNEFRALKNTKTDKYVRVYNMPVYYSNKTYPANVIFFGGRRWIMTTELDLFNLTEAQMESPSTWFFPEKTVATLENKFHGYHQANYTPLFISDPVDFDTPVFLPTPIGLGWWLLKAVNETERLYAPDAPLDALLTCKTPSCVGQEEDFCQNGGTCIADTGLCKCYHGAYGYRCELEGECYNVLQGCAGDGFCDESTGFCRCNLPHFGKLCNGTYKCYEEGGACRNGGLCNMATGVCDCPDDPTITGTACEKRADCGLLGCENGGFCVENGKCICRPPFYGTHCTLLNTTQVEFFCSSDQECMHGFCNQDTGVCSCDDPASYGTLCEHHYNCSEIDVRRQPQCLNSGTCDEMSGICDCPEPYFGPDCSQVPPCLEDVDCGGQWDKCDVESGRCDCNRGFLEGRRCEHPAGCESDDDCHGGTCDLTRGQCQCTPGSGYTGWLCQSLVVGMYPPNLDEIYQERKEDVQRCGFEDPFGHCLNEEDDDL